MKSQFDDVPWPKLTDEELANQEWIPWSEESIAAMDAWFSSSRKVKNEARRKPRNSDSARKVRESKRRREARRHSAGSDLV